MNFIDTSLGHFPYWLYAIWHCTVSLELSQLQLSTFYGTRWKLHNVKLNGKKRKRESKPQKQEGKNNRKHKKVKHNSK